MTGSRPTTAIRGKPPAPFGSSQLFELASRLFALLGRPLTDPVRTNKAKHNLTREPEHTWIERWKQGRQVVTLVHTTDSCGPLETADRACWATVRGLPSGVKLDLAGESPDSLFAYSITGPVVPARTVQLAWLMSSTSRSWDVERLWDPLCVPARWRALAEGWIRSLWAEDATTAARVRPVDYPELWELGWVIGDADGTDIALACSGRLDRYEEWPSPRLALEVVGPLPRSHHTINLTARSAAEAEPEGPTYRDLFRLVTGQSPGEPVEVRTQEGGVEARRHEIGPWVGQLACVPAPGGLTLLEARIQHGEGASPALFTRWKNVSGGTSTESSRLIRWIDFLIVGQPRRVLKLRELLSGELQRRGWATR